MRGQLQQMTLASMHTQRSHAQQYFLPSHTQLLGMTHMCFRKVCSDWLNTAAAQPAAWLHVLSPQAQLIRLWLLSYSAMRACV